MTGQPSNRARLGAEHGSLPPASVIVLTHDSAATIGACLASLRPQVDELKAELVVVDNASRDDSARVAAPLATRVVRSETNLGFAGGCNLGVASSRGAVVVLVNPDAELDPGSLAAVVAAAGDGRHGPVGGRARHEDGSFDPRCAMGRPSLRGALCFALGLDTLFRGSTPFDPEHGPTELAADGGLVEVAAVSGAMMAMDRRLWDALGGLDEDYFLYGEDVDICLRARAVGARPAVATSAGYVHVGGMTVDASTRRRVLLHRGKVELYRRHLPAPAATLAVLGLQAGALLRGLPSVVPVAAVRDRAQPWLELFRHRHDWRRGHVRAGDGGHALPVGANGGLAPQRPEQDRLAVDEHASGGRLGIGAS